MRFLFEKNFWLAFLFKYLTGPARINHLRVKTLLIFPTALLQLVNCIYQQNNMFIINAEINGDFSTTYRNEMQHLELLKYIIQRITLCS